MFPSSASLGGLLEFYFCWCDKHPDWNQLRDKGGLFQLTVPGHSSLEQGNQGVWGGGQETAGHTMFSQEQTEMNVCMLPDQLGFFHSYTVQGSAHDIVLPIHRVGFPTQLTLTGRKTG